MVSVVANVNVTNGECNLQAFAEAESFYIPNIYTGDITNITVSAESQPIHFSVKFPQPFIVSPESMTYNQSNVPLQFTVDSFSCSLDGI